MDALRAFGILFLATCWVIAFCNWLGFESFSPDKYAMWEGPVQISRLVVFGSVIAAVGYGLIKAREHTGLR